MSEGTRDTAGTFPPDQRFEVADSVLSQEVSGETVLLDLHTEKYFGLDPVGTRVWQLLAERKRVGEILSALGIEFDAERDRLESDVMAFLGHLLEAGLIAPGKPE